MTKFKPLKWKESKKLKLFIQLKQTYPDMEMAQLATMVADNSETDESQESSDEDEIDDERSVQSSSDEEFDDDNYYLQPVPAKKRRILLR